LVGVADFDLNPCGGTHVARTGEIGVLKIIRLDYRGDETRVEFLCGGRALDDYRSKNETVLALSARLTVGHWEVEEAVERLEEDFKAARRELRAVRERLLEEEAARLVREAPQIGPLRVIRRVWEGRDPGELRSLAQTVASHPQMIALLSSLGERTHLCVARSEGVDVDAEALLKEAFAELGGKGGGRPHLAQGSAPRAERVRVEKVLTGVVSGIRSSAGF
jgi:alanyl-tRNA synthetase